MIVFTGIAKAIFKKREDGAFDLVPGGESLTLCAALRAMKNEVSFISALSSDVPGQAILDFLIKNKLLFDPALISASLSSALVFESEGRRSVKISASAPSALSEEALLNAYSEHTDIEAIVASGDTLSFEPVATSVSSVAAFLSPRPVFIADVVMQDAEGSLDRMRKHILEADLVLLERGELGALNIDLGALKRYILIDGEDALYYEDGKLLKKEKFVSKADILNRLKFTRKATKVELEDYGK